MNYPQPIYNDILVRVETDSIKTIKYGSLELVAAGQDYNEDLRTYAQTRGYCVNVPRGASEGVYKFIDMEVEVGMRLFSTTPQLTRISAMSITVRSCTSFLTTGYLQSSERARSK